jgi:hypothetical protein
MTKLSAPWEGSLCFSSLSRLFILYVKVLYARDFGISETGGTLFFNLRHE